MRPRLETLQLSHARLNRCSSHVVLYVCSESIVVAAGARERDTKRCFVLVPCLRVQRPGKFLRISHARVRAGRALMSRLSAFNKVYRCVRVSGYRWRWVRARIYSCLFTCCKFENRWRNDGLAPLRGIDASRGVV